MGFCSRKLTPLWILFKLARAFVAPRWPAVAWSGTIVERRIGEIKSVQYKRLVLTGDHRSFTKVWLIFSWYSFNIPLISGWYPDIRCTHFQQGVTTWAWIYLRGGIEGAEPWAPPFWFRSFSVSYRAFDGRINKMAAQCLLYCISRPLRLAWYFVFSSAPLFDKRWTLVGEFLFSNSRGETTAKILSVGLARRQIKIEKVILTMAIILFEYSGGWFSIQVSSLCCNRTFPCHR